MQYFTYRLEKDGYINRFITTGTFCRPQTFRRVKLSGKVNEWLKKGFAIYENPCRREFVENRTSRTPEYIDLSKGGLDEETEVFGQRRRPVIYYPFGNQGVDFSDFYFNPTYLRCYSCTFLFSEEDCRGELRLETCGGVTLWVNDGLAADFIPFTRNSVKKKNVRIDLKKGLNKIVVCLDDLAERDTDYYFRLKYLGKENLKICIPAGEEEDVEGMYRVEKMLEDISFEKETYISEPVRLSIANPPDREVKVRVTYKPVADKISRAERLYASRDYVLEPGARSLELFSADEVIPGFYFFRVEAGLGKIKAGRTIAVQIFHRKLLEHKKLTIRERKQEALWYLRQTEVENVYKAAAILAVGGEREKAESILLEELEGIRDRKDCSDFHLIVVLQIVRLFGDKLSGEAMEAIRRVILGFRYWIDEPGDDVMWFFSENHALLFHICQYFAGAMYQDEVFTNSGLTGRGQMEKAEGLLEGWFEEFFKEYITEWNSNAYIPVDVLGLCGLYNLAEEGSRFKEYARKALDTIFRDLALNEHGGMIMTTFGRSYEKESKGNYAAGTTALLYLAYNRGCLNRAALAYISFALGEYEPPEEYRRFMELEGGKKMIFQKTQGFEKHVNLYMYKDENVQLSTAVEFHPFTPGYQEHIMQASLDATAQAFVNHPGETQPYGNGRPNYWSGNGSLPRAAQYKNLGILVYRIPGDHPVGFTHAYLPIMEFHSYMGQSGAVAAQKAGGYIGVRALGGLQMQTEGPCKYREFISPGRENIWLIKVGSREEYPDLADFYQSLSSIEVRTEQDGAVTVTDPGLGELVLGREGLTVDGKAVYGFPESPAGNVTIWGEENRDGNGV